MSIVLQYFASVQVGDSKGLFASASVRVGETDAKAYVAAADQNARDATKVGLLLDSLLDGTVAAGSQAYKMYRLDAQYINDAFAFPDVDDNTYNNNRWKVTVQTTNAGIPARDSFTIPQRNEAWLMESNGINVDLTDTEPENLCTQVVDTMLSKYGTAVTAVLEITAND